MQETYGIHLKVKILSLYILVFVQMEGKMNFAVKLMMVLIIMAFMVSIGSARFHFPPDCCPMVPACCIRKFVPKITKP